MRLCVNYVHVQCTSNYNLTTQGGGKRERRRKGEGRKGKEGRGRREEEGRKGKEGRDRREGEGGRERRVEGGLSTPYTPTRSYICYISHMYSTSGIL